MELYIVTGASRGLGRALVENLLAHREVCVLALSRAGVHGVDVWRDVRVDLGDDAGQDAAIEAIQDALGEREWTRTALINNAGMLEPIGINGTLDPGEVRTSIAVNLTAPIALMNAFLSASKVDGAVINISSGSGRRPVAGSGVYCTAKAGLDMASRVAALEVESQQRSITITALAPGIFETDMQVVARSKTVEEFPAVENFRAFKSQGLLKTPEEVAAKIVALDRARKLPAGIADLREL